MSSPVNRRPMDSESIISLLFLVVGGAFWIAFALFILIGEVPELLGL